MRWLVLEALTGPVETERGPVLYYADLEVMSLDNVDTEEGIWGADGDGIKRDPDGQPLLDLNDDAAAMRGGDFPLPALLDPVRMARWREAMKLAGNPERRRWAKFQRRVARPLMHWLLRHRRPPRGPQSPPAISNNKVPAALEPESLLRSAESVLLVDWPSVEVPRALMEMGLTVYGYSPDRWSEAKIVEIAGFDTSRGRPIPLSSAGGKGLVFQRLDGPSPTVDIVCVCRPAAELAEIAAKHLRPLGARVLWLQPPCESAEGARLAEANGCAFIQGVIITYPARNSPAES